MIKESSSKTATYRVLAVEHLTDHAYRLRTERGDLKFIAGQCANVGLPGKGVNREYSLCSAESDPYFDFLIKEVEGGLISCKLKTLKAGDFVEIHGCYGQFCLKDPTEKKEYLFIGSGTGIAPFHSFVRTYPFLNYKVLHGIRFKNECYGREIFSPERYVSCVSREDGGDFRGRVTDYLKAHPVKSDIIAYLCGNRSMLSDVYSLLREQGVPGDNLFTEAFF